MARDKVNRSRVEGDVIVKPTIVFYKLQWAYEQNYRIVSLQGSSRSGKTFNTMIWLCSFAYNNPNQKIAVVRSTMPRLRRTVYEDFKNVMIMLNIYEPSRMNEQNMEYEFDNGSKIVFFATEDAMAAQGLYSDILFVNEAKEIAEKVWQQLILRCKRMAIIDYNPDFPTTHWICKLNNEPTNRSRLFFFKTTYKDNPYLPPEQVTEIENLQYTDEVLWKVFGLGEQCVAEGLIFPNVMTCQDIPDYLEKKAYIGVDWGYKDPFAVTKVAIDYRRREIYCKEICYKSLMSAEEQKEVLLSEECAGRVVICDNASPQLKDQMARAGVRIRAAKKATSASRKSILPGIAVLRSFNIYITYDSTNALIEANNYVWKQDRNGEYLNEPIDKYNHFWDSVRYVVYTTGIGIGKFGSSGVGVKVY